MVLETFLNNKIHNLYYEQKTLQTEVNLNVQVVKFEIQQTSRGYKKFYASSVFCSNSFLGVEMLELKEFNDFLLLNKGLREVTRKGHLKSISLVLKNIQEPNSENFRQHILWMYNRGYSNSHIVNTIKSIEYFSEFSGQPFSIVKIKRPKKLITDYLTEAEISYMIRCARDLREKTMVTFLAFSGVRNQEFCNIKVKDLDFGNNQAFIRQGKFSKDRRINVGYKCVNLLIEYIMAYKKQPNDYLFTTIVNNNKYKNSDLRKFIKVLAKKAKIEKRVFPHIFRHSLATNLILRGASILLVKEQLGHTDIQTTMNYIQRLPIQVIKTQYEYHIPAYL